MSLIATKSIIIIAKSKHFTIHYILSSRKSALRTMGFLQILRREKKTTSSNHGWPRNSNIMVICSLTCDTNIPLSSSELVTRRFGNPFFFKALSQELNAQNSSSNGTSCYSHFLFVTTSGDYRIR